MFRRLVVLGVAAAAATGLSACGSGPDPGATPDAAQPLAGTTLTIGSKDFTESILLSQMAMQMLEANGATVNDKTNIAGSVTTRNALTGGDIDLYWEYTGTAWVSYLQQTAVVNDPTQLFDQVKQQDASTNKIAWFNRAPLDNTYAFAIRRSEAEKLGVTKLSEVAALAKTNPAAATFCIESEFSTRDDGWPGLTAAYGINVPPANVKMLDTGVIYTQTAQGDTCNFGEVFTTDGRIKALDLVVLQDDLKFFPIYNAAVTTRDTTLAEHPEIESILAPVAAALDTATMQQLNSRVDTDGEDPADVAQAWLTEKGFLSS
ncbi:glycine betaine ABC transporter substrate-binding protein [Pseudonocardia aurantiaca]|uniref:Glycine betaine ABC transporter substrate-binding protein n=1 Tax=Pseudonocardia aurantiaca TaxID=75290 RepID=A0ABW4FS62_9PSEU